jgi:hypothetical protein
LSLNNHRKEKEQQKQTNRGGHGILIVKINLQLEVTFETRTVSKQKDGAGENPPR